MPPPSPSSPVVAAIRRVDPRIWRACAGSSVHIPSVDSRVYYFPQGHLEHSSPSSHTLGSSVFLSRPFVLCRISAVHFLADPVTDEVFTRLLLVPLHPSSNEFLEPSGNVDDDEEEKIVAYAKILTPSDANNGGGFSVPRFCADLIFPPLDYQADPPVQTLMVTDIHGVAWDFRHIYRGTPRRHLLTTGWSKFVNHKKLIAGDSVVFMKNSRGEMSVGVRRSVRSNGGGDRARWRDKSGGGNGRVGLSSEAVAEAAERAAQGLAFEVVYYPRAGSCSDFVVRAEVVEAAVNGLWTAGMRVKMAVETEDSSRMTWFQGTVAAATVPDCGPWRGSPWRMLQVTWDEPEVLQNAKRVSPWQVDIVTPTPPIHSAFPPMKKFRLPENSELLAGGEGDLFFPMSGLTNSTVGHVNPSLLNYHTFPAGMQGARQVPFSVFGLCNIFGENAPQICTEHAVNNNMGPKWKNTSMEQHIGNSQSVNLSPDSQSSIHSFGTELVKNRRCNSTKDGIASFQLFGKIIHMSHPVESGYSVIGCVEDDGSKGYNETDGADNLLDLTLASSYMELLDRIDVQCQRASSVEACSL